MSELDRVKHLAGLTLEMDSARGLLKEYTVEDVADRQTLQKLAGIEEAMDGEITKDSVKQSALELLVDIAKTSKQYKGEVTDDQVHYLGSLVHDFDMAGIETEKYSEIEKLFRTMADTERADMEMIQPAYAQAKNLDEAYSPGDENEEGMVSDCCGAPIMDVYEGHGRCSDCKEMASAVNESKSEGDAWYIEQDARRMAEKDGHDWASMPYGRKSVYRDKAAEMRKGDEEDDDMYEAVGPAAEIFYEMQDMYAGGVSPSKPHETIIDELVRFLSGDQLEDFVETFRRHHMDLGDDMFKD